MDNMMSLAMSMEEAESDGGIKRPLSPHLMREHGAREVPAAMVANDTVPTAMAVDARVSSPPAKRRDGKCTPHAMRSPVPVGVNSDCSGNLTISAAAVATIDSSLLTDGRRPSTVSTAGSEENFENYEDDEEDIDDEDDDDDDDDDVDDDDDGDGDGDDESGTVEGSEEWFKGLVQRVREKNPNRGGGKGPAGGKWREEEDATLRCIVRAHGAKNWKKVAEMLGTNRTDVQCLHRWNKVLKPGLHKGPWTQEEDEIVKNMVDKNGVGQVKWSVIASVLPGRIGKQCRERWFNHLDPAIKKGKWADEEDQVLFESQRYLGNRWCEIVKLLPGRTENAVKNRFNSAARKKWLKSHPEGTCTLGPEMVEKLKEVYEQAQQETEARQAQQKASRMASAGAARASAASTASSSAGASAASTNAPSKAGGTGRRRSSCASTKSAAGTSQKSAAFRAASKTQSSRKGSTSAPGGPIGLSSSGLNSQLVPPSIITAPPAASVASSRRESQQRRTSQSQPVARRKGSQSQAAAVAARTWSPEGAPPAAAMSVDPSDLRSSSSSSHSQQHPARNGTSPVSAAVRRVSVNIPDLSPNEDVPLNLLPFFKYLSEEARRGIMRQLISSFSRSSISPMVSDALMRGGASRAAGDRSSFGAAGDIAGLEGALRPANPSTPGFLTPAMMSMIEEQLGENGDQDLGLADFRWEMTPTMGHPGHDPMGAPPSTDSLSAMSPRISSILGRKSGDSDAPSFLYGRNASQGLGKAGEGHSVIADEDDDPLLPDLGHHTANGLTPALAQLTGMSPRTIDIAYASLSPGCA